MWGFANLSGGQSLIADLNEIFSSWTGALVCADGGGASDDRARTSINKPWILDCQWLGWGTRTQIALHFLSDAHM
jgi:hypothetical protein